MRTADAPEPLLVLGATSLVGRFLPSFAQAQGQPLVAVSRSPQADAPGLRWVAADLAAPDLAERLPGAATVLSLSPIWLLPPALPALATGGMTRLVAFSSTSRFSKAASPDPGERAVASSLAQAEEATIAFCEARGIGWTLLRPTLIYAEGLDGNVSRLAGLIRRFGVVPVAGRGAGLRQPVHGEDLARAALDVLGAPSTVGRAYDLPGGETLSYRAMVERVFDGLGRRPRIVHVRPALWALGLKLASRGLPGATAAMGARMDADLAFDPAPARRDFGWAPRAFHPRFAP